MIICLFQIRHHIRSHHARAGLIQQLFLKMQDQEQNMNSVMEGLATVGRPTGDGWDSSILDIEGAGRAM